MNMQTGFDFKVPYDPRQIAPFAFAAYLTPFDVLILKYLPACLLRLARLSKEARRLHVHIEIPFLYDRSV